MVFVSSVLFILSMVVFFNSFSYMSNDSSMERFLYLVLLFILSMLFVITSMTNVISILLGWDSLSLIYYSLVIYFQNSKSYSAGMLTVLVNRLVDVSILISIALMFSYGSWFFHSCNYLFNNNGNNVLLVAVVLASFTSSAQIPFSSWFPAASAAPTPLFALDYSTLVTAEVYLLIRFVCYFDHSSLFAFLSLSTMFVASLGPALAFMLLVCCINVCLVMCLAILFSAFMSSVMCSTQSCCWAYFLFWEVSC